MIKKEEVISFLKGILNAHIMYYGINVTGRSSVRHANSVFKKFPIPKYLVGRGTAYLFYKERYLQLLKMVESTPFNSYKHKFASGCISAYERKRKLFKKNNPELTAFFEFGFFVNLSEIRVDLLYNNLENIHAIYEGNAYLKKQNNS